MVEPPEGRDAVLVVRVWYEPEAADGGFRARVTWTQDVRAAGTSTVVTEPDQLMSVLTRWLAGVTRGPGPR